MRTYKEIPYTGTHTVLDQVRCDLCEEVGIGEQRWKTGVYEVNDTEISITIRHKKGKEYPEDGYGIEYIVDICPKCFQDKLIPWLQSQRANIEPIDWDY